MKQNKKVPKTKITICMSFEVLDKLEELSEKYNTSRSRMIEKCIMAVYNAITKAR